MNDTADVVAGLRALIIEADAVIGQAQARIDQCTKAIESLDGDLPAIEHGRLNRGRRRKVDYDRVAVVAIAAYAEQRSMVRSVAEAFDISHEAAQKRIQYARRRGHDIPLVPNGFERILRAAPAPAPVEWGSADVLSVLEAAG